MKQESQNKYLYQIIWILIYNYSFEFTPTETSTGGTLLYIANHLSNKCNIDLNIYKKNELESTFIEGNQGNQIFYTQSFADIDLSTLLTLVKII